MTIHTPDVGVVVEVAPLSSQRVQVWARLATRASSTCDLNILQCAFQALWWESEAYDSFQRVLVHWQGDMMQWVVSWHGHVVGELRLAILAWDRVVQLLQHEGVSRSLTRAMTETVEQVQRLHALATQLAQQTVTLCLAYSLPLPRAIREEVLTGTLVLNLNEAAQHLFMVEEES